MLLCDDHAMFRQGLRSILEIEQSLRVIGEAATGREAVRYALETRPDVVLMDIQMPELDGVAATKEILAEDGDAKVIILTMYRQDHYVFEAIKAGARGYLLKDADANDLIDAIRRVGEGETLLNAELAASILDEFRKVEMLPEHPEHTLSELTEREADILRLVARGNLEPGDRRGPRGEREDGSQSALRDLFEAAPKQPDPSSSLRAPRGPRLAPGSDRVTEPGIVQAGTGPADPYVRDLAEHSHCELGCMPAREGP